MQVTSEQAKGQTNKCTRPAALVWLAKISEGEYSLLITIVEENEWVEMIEMT